MKKIIKQFTQNLLKNLAKKVLAKHQLDIIGITGSAGKSSAKEAIFQVLKGKFNGRVKKSEGNLNTEIGLPLAILGFKNSPSMLAWPIVLIAAFFRANFSLFDPLKNILILVLEYAADKHGDIDCLTKIAHPKIGVISSIGAAHTEFFGNVENVAKEKFSLVKALTKEGYAIFPKDCPFEEVFIKKIKAKIVYFSGESLEPYKEIAKIVGKIYQIPDKEIKNTLDHYQQLAGRANIIKGIKNTTIIDDTYNANPLSMQLALRNLIANSEKLKANRRIIILGDMRELGNLSQKYHAEIYHQAQKLADLLITVGSEFRKISPDNNFTNSQLAGEFILSKLENNDIILVKGSRAIRMEKVVRTLIHE